MGYTSYQYYLYFCCVDVVTMRTQNEPANGSHTTKIFDIAILLFTYGIAATKTYGCIPQNNVGTFHLFNMANDKNKKPVEQQKTDPLPDGTGAQNLVDAKNATDAAAKLAEPTNSKIEELKAKRLDAKKRAREFEPDSKEADELDIEAWKLGEEIKKEIANIRYEEAKQKAEEEKAKRVQLYFDARDTFIALQNDPTNATLIDASQKAEDAIKNALLAGKFAGTATTSGTAKTGGTGTKGATTAAITALIRPMYEGVTRDNVAEVGKEVRRKIINDEGFNDGTANAVIIEFERELGLKDRP